MSNKQRFWMPVFLFEDVNDKVYEIDYKQDYNVLP